MYFIETDSIKEFNKIDIFLRRNSFEFSSILKKAYIVFSSLKDAKIVSSKYEKKIYVLKEVK